MQTLPPLTSHSLPPPTLHPLNTWTFLFIVHIPTQNGNMHTQRLKTFQPQPQEPNGGRGYLGAGPRKTPPTEPPGARRLLHKQRRAGGAALGCARKEKWVTGRCGIGLPFPSEQGARHHENLLPLFPSPRFKELRLGWGDGTKTRGAPFRCPQNERTCDGCFSFFLFLF